MHNDFYSEIYYNFTKKTIRLHRPPPYKEQGNGNTVPLCFIYQRDSLAPPNLPDENQLAISEMNLILTKRISSSE